MAHSRPVMLVGGAGCGKTVLVNNKLDSLQETTMVTTIPFNHYTTSLMLQGVMEAPLEKKSGMSHKNLMSFLNFFFFLLKGRNYGPPGTKKLIYFIDDMNMPEVDAYGTVQPHTLIRQHLDYQHWYRLV